MASEINIFHDNVISNNNKESQMSQNEDIQ